MLEKLLLAATLTFALSLFADLGWSPSSYTARGRTGDTLPTLTLTQRPQ
ncbi:MAG: hypothetical protein SAK29_24780 [Scytonema sp. PMC 1069.18]|nr:hypothetical protein [Scytonema sp. PMC 1069.18]MEC4886564.1 hypothetical protein [Scytonema sp. PMC 1070.18]